MKLKKRPIHLRILFSISALALIVACIYSVFTGINIASGGVILIALLSLGVPVAAGGGSVMEVLSGIFEAFIQGITGVFEAIGSALNF